VALFDDIQETLSWFKLLFLEKRVERWLIYFMGMIDELKENEVIEVCHRLSLSERLKERLTKGRQDTRTILYEFFKDKRMRPSHIYRLLKPISLEVLLFMMAKAKDETSKRYISLYLTELHKVNISLSGKDLKAMGIEPGPIYKEILDRILNGRLDGEIKGREEERRFVIENFLKEVTNRS